MSGEGASSETATTTGEPSESPDADSAPPNWRDVFGYDEPYDKPYAFTHNLSNDGADRSAEQFSHRLAVCQPNHGRADSKPDGKPNIITQRHSNHATVGQPDNQPKR